MAAFTQAVTEQLQHVQPSKSKILLTGSFADVCWPVLGALHLLDPTELEHKHVPCIYSATELKLTTIKSQTFHRPKWRSSKTS